MGSLVHEKGALPASSSCLLRRRPGRQAQSPNGDATKEVCEGGVQSVSGVSGLYGSVLDLNLLGQDGWLRGQTLRAGGVEARPTTLVATAPCTACAKVRISCGHSCLPGPALSAIGAWCPPVHRWLIGIRHALPIVCSCVHSAALKTLIDAVARCQAGYDSSDPRKRACRGDPMG